MFPGAWKIEYSMEKVVVLNVARYDGGEQRPAASHWVQKGATLSAAGIVEHTSREITSN